MSRVELDDQRCAIPIELTPLQKLHQERERREDPEEPTIISEANCFGSMFSNIFDNRYLLITVSVIAGIAAILILILVPMSFSGIEYYEVGFKQRKSTGVVYRDKIFDFGKYYIGPDNTFMTLLATTQFQTISIAIFDKEKVEINVKASFQYILDKEKLSELILKFGLDYKSVVSQNSITTLKNIAVKYTLKEYILKRKEIEDDFLRSLQLALEKVYMKVLYFQLLSIKQPWRRLDKKVQSLIMPEQNEAEKIKQRAKDIRLETEFKVQKFENDGKVRNAQADAEKRLFYTNAETASKSIVDKARYNGLKTFYEKVELIEAKDKIAFDYLRTLQNSDKVRLKINFDKLIGVVRNDLIT